MLKPGRVPSIAVALAALCLLPVLLAGCGGWNNITSSTPPSVDIIATGGADKTITLRNIADGKSVKTIPNNDDTVFSMDFSPDGRYLAVGGLQYLNIWNLAESKLFKSYIIPPYSHNSVKGVKYSPDGKFLVCFRTLDRAYKIDLTKDAGPIVLNPGAATTDVAISSSGKYIAVADASAKVFNSADCTLYKDIRNDFTYSIAFTPDEKSVVLGVPEKTLNFKNFEPGGVSKIMPIHYSGFFFLDMLFLSDESVLVSPNEGSYNAIEIWNCQTGTHSLSIIGHTIGSAVKRTSISLSADNSRIAASYADGVIEFFDARSGELIWTQTVPDGSQAVAFPR